MTDLSKLEAIVRARTPGPWHLSADGERILQTAHLTRDVWEIPHKQEDMPFIATMGTLADLILDVIRAADDLARLGPKHALHPVVDAISALRTACQSLPEASE